jgi:hypothetical protein
MRSLPRSVVCKYTAALASSTVPVAAIAMLPGRRRAAARQHATPAAPRTAGIGTDRIDNTGLVTLRHQGRLYHIGIGRPHAGTRVLLLVQDLHIRVINADTGELLRELVLNPDKRYQATGKTPGWPKKNTANHT